jgi:hypothetical protein
MTGYVYRGAEPIPLPKPKPLTIVVRAIVVGEPRDWTAYVGIDSAGTGIRRQIGKFGSRKLASQIAHAAAAAAEDAITAALAK